MKFFSLDRLKKIGQDAERGWPGYLLGGHVRTSTVVLVIAFVAVWWVYDSNKHTQSSTPTQVPATQVVPPGYVPDPNYTWVPRSRLQQPPTTRTWTPTTTTTTTTTTPPTTTTTTTTPPPPFQLPVLPPPFGPGTTTSSSTPPPPGPEPAPAPPPIP
ncbi:hypothetical protein MFM001_26830 [Mycobacterium sp. MFM001]|uniref:hypothetical protein n=1 Tax=Mycobacterium sp. MFM001 TaxID=2049453 RepID=UPI000DA4EE9A|nr:hypothetical protein [Mycobacterium sp. MFM001]GBE66221.1 hypothetical protein MFM001_26830 [Mycobacterium sp. MFM001]